MNLLNKLLKEQLINPPTYLIDSTFYVTRMGSVAYGVSTNYSDEDYYGFCVPPLHILFPHLGGRIQGWDNNYETLEQWQHHGISYNDTKYDFQIYNIIKYFRLCADCNPNMIDSLFTNRVDVVHSTAMAELVRDNRKLFLSKKAWHTFKGYAYSQLSKLDRKPEGKRKEIVDKYGFDVKYAYHIVRLIDEVEQILTIGDIDLHRAKEHMKAVREGRVSKDEIREWFSIKEKTLEKVYHESKIPYEPQEAKIKQLLLHCIETHYGSIDKYIVNVSKEREIISQVARLVQGY